MDCCGHEGAGSFDATFEFKTVADGVHVAVAAPACHHARGDAEEGSQALDVTHIVMGHGDVASRDWLQVFRGYVHDMVEAVRAEVTAGATLDEVKARVPATLAPVYEKPFSTYGDYRPWRTLILGNIERAFAHVS